MPTLKTEYLGSLRNTITHLQSGNTLITDAPTDNNGKGESFSPTDLVAAALGSCMVTIMGIRAAKLGLTVDGMHYETTKVMAAQPRRIAALEINIHWPQPQGTAEQREYLKNEARSCPVALSLHPDLRQAVTFHF